MTKMYKIQRNGTVVGRSKSYNDTSRSLNPYVAGTGEYRSWHMGKVRVV